MKAFTLSTLLLLTATLVFAAPVANPQLGALIQTLTAILKPVFANIQTALKARNTQGVLQILRGVQPSSTPTSVPDAFSRLQSINGTNPANIFQYIAAQRSLGLIDSIDSIQQYVAGFLTGQNSMNNINPAPPVPIYPRAASTDPSYSVPEASLRGAIYIPQGFTYGKKPPVILVPGTGSTGYTAYKGNYIPLLQAPNSPGDPVWLNIPGFMLNDIQSNAEYVAYAIHYIRAITSRNVTIVAWSQGNPCSQWVYKYWVSTRSIVSDHFGISADYDGTVLATFLFPDELGLPVPPAILQQQYLADSNFITTLQRNNGDSAYVPTTSVYSSFLDEIVQPQVGTIASAYTKNVRGAGAENAEIQKICPGQPAGSFYTHEGVLYNPIGWALFLDALANPGPGRIQSLNLAAICPQYLSPGLDLGDLKVTEAAIAIAGIAILTYGNYVQVEPPIRPYATY